MPVDRVVYACTAVASLALATAALLTLRGEAAYRVGQVLDPDPDRDAPGRLDAYQRATELRPDDGFYAWRTSQVLYARGLTQSGDERRETLRSAASEVERAVAALPLDGRVQTTAAQIHWSLGLHERAIEELRRARRVAPLHQSVAALAGRMFADAWVSQSPVADGGVQLLRDACAAAAVCRMADQDVPTRWVGQHLAQAGNELFGRVLGDAAGDPDLLEEVALALERVRPADAALLRDMAADARRRQGAK